MASIHFESSFTPPLDFQLPDVSVGSGRVDISEPDQGLGPNLWLKIIRPKFSMDLPVIGNQTIAPGGDPITWYLGLGGLLLAVAILSSLFTRYVLKRK